MDASRQKPRLLSDVRAPARRARSVLAVEVRSSGSFQPREPQHASYARFYRKAVVSARQVVNEAPSSKPAPEVSRVSKDAQSEAPVERVLVHQAVVQARPLPKPAQRDYTAERRKHQGRRGSRRAANLLVAIAIILSCVMGFMVYRYHLALKKVEAMPLQAAVDSGTSDASEDAPAALNEAKTAGAIGAGNLAKTTPYTISIPKLKVSASITSVGVTKQGAMNVPGNIWQVGWYKTSSKPADNTGVVIMNGHVHGPTQPGVFANLKNLKAGDIITVKDAGGTIYTYKVDSSQTFKAGEANESLMQSASPTKQGLNLVTCTGEIKGDEYQSRLVVFAERV